MTISNTLFIPIHNPLSSLQWLFSNILLQIKTSTLFSNTFLSFVPNDGWSVHSKRWTFQNLIHSFYLENFLALENIPLQNRALLFSLESVTLN
jgi:hypothetical protein